MKPGRTFQPAEMVSMWTAALSQTAWAIYPPAFDQMCRALETAHLAAHAAVQAANLPNGASQATVPAPEAAQPPRDRIGLFEPLRNALKIVDGVAIIEIVGPMFPTRTRLGEFFGETPMDEVEQEVQAAAGNSLVRSILLLIDSPGGSVSGTDSLGRAVKAAAAAKPVIVFSPNVLASAAYWVASQASRILIGGTCVVGSIGVRGPTLFDYTGMLEQLGLKSYPIATSQYKSTGAIGAVSDAQIADQERIVNEIHASFRAVVKAGRGLSDAQLDAVADARVHVGEQALALKLADAIATFDQAMDEARQAGQRQRPGTTGASAAAAIAASTTAGAESATATTQTTETGGASAGIPDTAQAPASAAAAEADNRQEATMSQTNGGTATQPASATQQTPTQAQTAAEPRPATIAELKAAFPNDPAFALDAAEKAYTMDEAKSIYAMIEARVRNVQASATQQPAAQQPAARKPGVPAIETKTTPTTEATATGDAVADFNAAVEEQMKKPGYERDRKKAVLAVAKRDPALHRAFLEATNKSRVQRDLIADKYD